MSVRTKLKNFPGVRPALRWRQDIAGIVRQQRVMVRHGVGYFNWWPQESVAQSWFYRFLRRPALRDHSERYRIGFFSVFGRRRVLQLARCDRRIFFTGEALSRFPEYQDHLLGRVDLALGFASLDHPRYLRFPIWLLECFDPQATLADIRHQLKGAVHAGARTADKHAVLVARHDMGGIRGQLGDLVQTVGPVDYGGSFRHNLPEELGAGWSAKRELLQRYRFNICPENTSEVGYVTEKVFQSIAAGCVPIYWGNGGRAPEADVLNPEAILYYDPERPDHLQDRLGELAREAKAWNALRQLDPFRPGAAEHIYAYYERLEARLRQILR